MPQRRVTMDGWPVGIDNVSESADLSRSALREATNVDIDRRGRVRRRRGVSLQQPNTGMHSGWSVPGWDFALVVQDTSLLKLASDLTSTTLRSDLTAGAEVSYFEHNGDIYYSNGSETGIVRGDGTHGTWGVEQPASQPSLAAHGTGGMTAGAYQVIVTFLASSGEESGVNTYASTVDVVSGGGIQLTAVPQPAEANVTHVRVYATEPNGDVLYHRYDIPVGITSYVLGALDPGKQLDGQFFQRMPAGHIVRARHGRMLVASGKTLYYSDALRFGLCKMPSMHFRFASTITMVEPVAGGIFVADSHSTYFLAGMEVSEAVQARVHDHAAIPGASMLARGDEIGQDGFEGRIALWWSKSGELMLGGPDGSVKSLTNGRYATDPHTSGVMFYRDLNGLRQIITRLQGATSTSPKKAEDDPIAEVRTNGVL